jgi:hypothetical protein
MPMTTSTSTRTHLVEVMTVNAVFVCPRPAESSYFAQFLFMTHYTFTNPLGFMALMIEFNIMFKADDIFGKSVLGK